jgi:hypothetical protein
MVCQRDIVSETSSLLLAPNFSEICFLLSSFMKKRGQVTRWLPLVDGKATSDCRDNQAGDRAACDDGGAARPATLSTRIWLDFLLFCSEFCQIAPSHLWGPRPTLLLSDIAPSVVAREKLSGI